jgi:tryptophanyl-tRNA synthetase
VLQAADILLYKATHVPVGQDQVPHVELTREIAKRFNFLYCADRAPVLVEPDAQLTEFARLRGLDGNRMSKSMGNTILLAEEPAELERKVMQAYTDPKKVRKDDPGRPEADEKDGHPGCVVWEYHRKFNAGEADAIAVACRAGKLGCVADKKHLAKVMSEALEPIRERRLKWEKDKDAVRDVLRDGSERARAVARETMDQVRSAMGVKSIVEPR